MAAGGWTYAALAQQVEVDPKSVERWVNLGRIPRRATALQAAKALGEDVHALWPALRQARPARAISPELVALYEQRADIPVSTFIDLMAQARERIDILVYAAVFLHEAYPRLNELLTERAAEGCTVRIAIGDPDSDNVQACGQEERFGHGIESRCRLALMHYKPLADTPGIEVRTHGTTLYNSLYRADDQQLVNAHVWGVNAYAAPCGTFAVTRQAACSTPTPRASTPCGRRQPRTRGRLTVARTEYYDDPNAPKPNSMVVAASAVVTDDHGRILLQRRRDNDLWALPGGGMDLTDSLPGTAVREVKEETGLDVEITGLVGTYTDPKHIIAYTDGEVRRQFNVCFTARITGGRLEISDESTELRFVPPEEIEQLPMHHTQRLRLQHFLEHREKPYLG